MKQLLIVALALLVPIVPFVFFGDRLDAWLERWRESEPGAAATAAAVVGLLGTDIFLPVPSSFVSTLAGAQLGIAGGAAASCLGMTLGAVAGFALARRWGPPLARRLADPAELASVRAATDAYGPAALVVLRGVPVLAEASVLLAGVHGLSWPRFLAPVLLSNLGISLAYSAFGRLAAEHQWLPAALGISLALPLLIAALARRWLPRVNPS